MEGLDRRYLQRSIVAGGKIGSLSPQFEWIPEAIVGQMDAFQEAVYTTPLEHFGDNLLDAGISAIKALNRAGYGRGIISRLSDATAANNTAKVVIPLSTELQFRFGGMDPLSHQRVDVTDLMHALYAKKDRPGALLRAGIEGAEQAIGIIFSALLDIETPDLFPSKNELSKSHGVTWTEGVNRTNRSIISVGLRDTTVPGVKIRYTYKNASVPELALVVYPF